jgi:hypothetical protein
MGMPAIELDYAAKGLERFRYRREELVIPNLDLNVPGKGDNEGTDRIKAEL